MTRLFKPHVIALICSAGILAAAGTLYLKSRVPQPIAEASAEVQPAAPAAPAATPPPSR